MAKRKGNTVTLESRPSIISNAAVVGKKEGEGPLAPEFDKIFEDTTMGQDCWEKAESELIKASIYTAIEKADISKDEVQAVYSGDLLSQCIGSTFGIRELELPFCGIYGACSTMALTMLQASLAIESGGFDCCIAATSSHFCSAEKQFRYPLEYGGQRPPTAQWTVTGSGAVVLKRKQDNHPYIHQVHLGTIQDLGIKDANNMGAAMAPAARKTISDFLRDTSTKPEDYDIILTGDLGSVGSKLLRELLLTEDGIDISRVHSDCGLLIFDSEAQDVHSGGSGCGCSASVLCSHALNGMRTGLYRNILFIATGALLSTVSAKEGESIPGIAHLINIRKGI